jgi:hypothetical protein
MSSVTVALFIARCSHLGIRSTFRGLKITMMKNAMLYSIYEFISKFKFEENRLAENITKGLVGVSGYLLMYPLENIKIRMGADL